MSGEGPKQDTGHSASKHSPLPWGSCRCIASTAVYIMFMPMQPSAVLDLAVVLLHARLSQGLITKNLICLQAILSPAKSHLTGSGCSGILQQSTKCWPEGTGFATHVEHVLPSTSVRPTSLKVTMNRLGIWPSQSLVQLDTEPPVRRRRHQNRIQSLISWAPGCVPAISRQKPRTRRPRTRTSAENTPPHHQPPPTMTAATSSHP